MPGRSFSAWATALLLAFTACAPPEADSAADELDDSGAPARRPLTLPLEVEEALLLGREVDVLVQLDTQAIERAIAFRRTVRDHAGDRPALLEARATAWRSVHERFAGQLPPTVELRRAYEQFPVLVLRLRDLNDADALARNPEVVAIEANVGHAPSLTQSLAYIEQPEAEASGLTGAGTAVAILDTGADWTHRDLGSCTAVGSPATCRVAYAADVATSDSSRDDNGHGTNVSAIAAAVAPGADILALDVFRSDGLAYSSDILTAIDWVIANKSTYDIASINMSLGSGSYTAACAGSFSTAITSAKNAGISVAVASGNNGYTSAISSPACATDALSVGAVYDANVGGVAWSACTDSTTSAGKVACFSNSASILDVLAPGALITAGGYTMGGTSMAAPHVAGALAVLRAEDPTASVSELEAELLGGSKVTDSRNGLSFPVLNLAAEAAPTGTISINAGAAGTTSATVTITATASGGVATMCVSNTSSCTAWTTYAASSSWTLSSTAGTKTVYAWFRNSAGTTSAVTSDTIVLDTTKPTGTVSLASGAAWTTGRSVAATLSASDTSGVSSMCLSTSTSCSSWVSYATSATVSLSSTAGTKTVYAWFKDAYGNMSSATSDTIGYDATAPTNATLTATATSGGASLAWTASTDATSGLARYKLVYGTSNPASGCLSGTVNYNGNARTRTLSGLTAGTRYYLRLCSIDTAGNTSTGATAYFTPL